MTTTTNLRHVNHQLDNHPFDVYDRVVSPKGRAAVVESIGWTGKRFWMQVRYCDTHRLVNVMDLDGWKRHNVEVKDRGFEAERFARSARHARSLKSYLSDYYPHA